MIAKCQLLDFANDAALRTQLIKDVKVLEHRSSVGSDKFECIICWEYIDSTDPVVSTCCWQLFCRPCAIQYFIKNGLFEINEIRINTNNVGRCFTNKESIMFPAVIAPCCRKELWAPLSMHYSNIDLTKIVRDSIIFFGHIRILVYAPYVHFEKFRAKICARAVEYDYLKSLTEYKHKSYVLFVNDVNKFPKQIVDHIDMIMIVDLHQANNISTNLMKLLKKRKSAISVIHFFAPMIIKR